MDAMRKGISGNQEDDPRWRNAARDFIQRYDDGPPHENITDEEARSHYLAVADRLSTHELEDSAAESYARLTPDERRRFANMLRQQGGDQSGDATTDDPRKLARMTSQLQTQPPGGLAGLLDGGVMDGGDGGAVGSQVRGQGGGVGELLQNPVARAALGGIAAAAMRKMLG